MEGYGNKVGGGDDLPTQAPAASRKERGTRAAVLPRMSEMIGGALAPSFDRFSKTNHAYTILRSQILDGVYRPGDWLRMSRIAASLNLSEMPVREALRLLEKDGLVTNHLHRGVQVAALSFQRALDITEVRMHLEALAARESLGAHDAESLGRASEVIAQMMQSSDDTVRFAVLNRDFATAIYTKCRNEFLREHIQHLWDQVWQHSSTAVFDVMRHRIEDSLEENRRIVAALRDGNAAMLQATYDERLTKSLDAWSAAINKSRAVA